MSTDGSDRSFLLSVLKITTSDLIYEHSMLNECALE